MFSINGLDLPEFSNITYDKLLQNAVEQLGKTNSYFLIVFCSNQTHYPSYSWILTAYASLDKKIKKNLKKLFIVHHNVWTKLIFQV